MIGSTVKISNSTITVDNTIIKGSNNVITGDRNRIKGANNKVKGHHNTISGSNNVAIGYNNRIVAGRNNELRAPSPSKLPKLPIILDHMPGTVSNTEDVQDMGVLENDLVPSYTTELTFFQKLVNVLLDIRDSIRYYFSIFLLLLISLSSMGQNKFIEHRDTICCTAMSYYILDNPAISPHKGWSSNNITVEHRYLMEYDSVGVPTAIDDFGLYTIIDPKLLGLMHKRVSYFSCASYDGVCKDSVHTEYKDIY